LNEQKPLLVVIAGPMGAGKTIFYDAHLKEAFPVLIPPVPHQREAMLRERRSFAVEDLIIDTELLGRARDRRLRHEGRVYLYRRCQPECRTHPDPNDSRRAVSAAEHHSGVVQAVHEELAGGSKACR